MMLELGEGVLDKMQGVFLGGGGGGGDISVGGGGVEGEGTRRRVEG